MKKPILKSYFGEIFFEFMVHKEKRDAIIILPGFPSSNNLDEIISFFYEKGFHVFFPRYKGTFQSKGFFLGTNPVNDLTKFVTQLKKERAINLWDMKRVHFKINKLYLLGGSFGGSVACALSATSREVTKAVVASPIWDYEMHNKEFKEQDLVQLTRFVKRAFRNLYRYNFNNLVDKMKKFKEFSFSFYEKNLKKPILIFHDSNDYSVSIKHSRNAVKNIKNLKLIETDAGHGLSIKLLRGYYSQIEKFLRD